MNEDSPLELSEPQRRARDAVRSLPAPEADPAFRARLAREFAAGTVAPPRPRVLPWFRRRGLARVWVPAAAAAALAIAVGVANRGPAWRVTAVTGEGVAVVDGRPVPLGHLDELRRLVRPGARVRVPDGARIEITSPERAVVEFTPGTDVTVPEVPGRWFARRVSAEVRAGELRITTGRAFHGARLSISTPEAMVQVTGTTLAVICDPDGTCVCVLEGTVRVGPHGGDMVAVGHGHRRFVYNDARPPETAAIRPVEQVELTRLRLAKRAEMGMGAPAR